MFILWTYSESYFYAWRWDLCGRDKLLRELKMSYLKQTQLLENGKENPTESLCSGTIYYCSVLRALQLMRLRGTHDGRDWINVIRVQSSHSLYCFFCSEDCIFKKRNLTYIKNYYLKEFFVSFLTTPGYTQGTPSFAQETSWRVQGHIWDADDRTQIKNLQGKCPTRSSIASGPLKNIFT